ncbi:MAG: hypothetical protein R6T96_05785, partial [Longimicrobiales bacterium]
QKEVQEFQEGMDRMSTANREKRQNELMQKQHGKRGIGGPFRAQRSFPRPARFLGEAPIS